MNDQTTIPDVPPVGHLKKLRTTLLPSAERIIQLAKGADITKDGRMVVWEQKRIAQSRRTIDKRLASLGIPIKSVRRPEDFPTGTQEAAAASGECFVALESAMSAISAVHEAELAAIPGARP